MAKKRVRRRPPTTSPASDKKPARAKPGRANTTAGKRKEAKKRRRGSARARAKAKSQGEWTTIAIPEGTKMFKLDNDKPRRIDVLPYIVGGGDNRFADEGMEYYERTFHTHRNIGPNRMSYVCPNMTTQGKQPCPICEYRAELVNDPDADEKTVKELAPSERQLFNVIDLGNPDDGVQLWDISNFYFGQELDKLMNEPDEDMEEEYDGWDCELFWTHDEGRSLRLRVEEKHFAGRKSYKVDSITLKERKSQYDDTIFDDTHCLDSLLKILPYEELKSIFLQTGKTPEGEGKTDENKEKKTRKPRQTKAEKLAEAQAAVAEDQDLMTAEEAGIEVGSTVIDDKWGECVVVAISKDGTSITVKDDDGKKHRALAPEDLTVVASDDDDFDEDDDDSESESEDDDFDDDDDDFDEDDDFDDDDDDFDEDDD